MDLAIGDVHSEVRGLQHGAGFILFLRGGAIACLEGYTYGDDSWPEHPDLLRLFYVRHSEAGSPWLVESKERHLPWTDRI